MLQGLTCATEHYMGLGLPGRGSAVSTIGTAGRSQVAGWKGHIRDAD